MPHSNNPIAVFDSGVGGLTVLKELLQLLPCESFIYLGDTARTPYGTRSSERITEFATENIIFLMKFSPKLIVVACNTVSSTSLDYLNNLFAVPIIGVIKPGARAAARSTRNNKIGVIGTTATISSSAYTRAIKATLSDAKIFTASCPLFVPLVEEGFLSGEIPTLIVQHYLSGIKGKGIDTLLLGCTHYPLLLKPIRDFIGKDVAIVDSAKSTAIEVKDFLLPSPLCKQGSTGELKFFVTDAPEKFKGTGEKFLGKTIKKVFLVKK